MIIILLMYSACDGYRMQDGKSDGRKKFFRSLYK